MRLLIAHKCLVMYVGNQVFPVLTGAFIIVHGIIIYFMLLYWGFRGTSRLVIDGIACLIQCLLMHFHDIHDILLAFPIHENGYYPRRARFSEEYPLDFFVVEVLPCFPHYARGLELAEVHDLCPIGPIFGRSRGGSFGDGWLGPTCEVPKGGLLIAIDDGIGDVDLRALVEEGIFGPQVVVEVLYQTIPLELHVQTLRHFCLIFIYSRAST